MPCSCDRRGMWDRRENVIIALVMKWLGTVDSWDILKKAFIQRYCPPSRTAKQLKEIRNFKHEGDKTLYQAWEWYNDLLYKCPTHDINNHQKVNIFYNGFGAMNRQLLDSQGPIPGMTPVQALTAIQTMTDHSQKWHDGSSSRNIGSSPPGYYTCMENRPPFREKRPCLEELMNKHMEESTRRRTEMEEWVKKLQENAKINSQNQSASLKNLETQIEQLT
ncbi:putative ribonuclease H-like domain-containing protein, partial [Tanacetum coccineum]